MVTNTIIRKGLHTISTHTKGILLDMCKLLMVEAVPSQLSERMSGTRFGETITKKVSALLCHYNGYTYEDISRTKTSRNH